MEAGRLRHRVMLQMNRATQDPSSGSLIDNWVSVGEVWAAVEPLSGRALIAAQAAQSDVTTNIIVRYRADVTDDMRIVHRGKPYYITVILSDKESGLEYMTMPCTNLPHA